MFAACRWGLLYGGPQWSWSWDMQDSAGCTPLHIAAAQPPLVYKALLDTLSCGLPQHHLSAAQAVWFGCTGGIAHTPVEWAQAVLLPGMKLDRMWRAAATAPAASSRTRPAAVAVCAVDSRSGAAECSGACSSTAVADDVSSADELSSAKVTVRDVWRVLQSPEYQDWVSHRVRGAMQRHTHTHTHTHTHAALVPSPWLVPGFVNSTSTCSCQPVHVVHVCA